MTVNKSVNRRILIVDDCQNIHTDFMAILAPGDNNHSDMLENEALIFGDSTPLPTENKFEVDEAFQGEEALDMVRAAHDEGRPYALAFVDMLMPPGWDGVTTIEKLWEVCPDLEIVICTAYSHHDWHSIVDRLGNPSRLLILKKPFASIEILQFATSLTEKWNLAYEARQRENSLENTLSHRTVELTNINTELERFAYIISNNIKGPLRGIQSLTDWILLDQSEKLGTKGAEQLYLLQDRAKLMCDMVEGILHYSSVRHAESNKSQVNLQTVISEVIEFIDVPSSITITIDSPLPTIEFEETQIFQVFQNLLGNAAKYMNKAQGSIHIGFEEQEDTWLFSVKDNGIGIDAKDFDKIFKLFQKLNYAEEYESSGIGLSLAKKIVENHKGKIWVESEVGIGSTFWFTLPKQLSEQTVELAQTNP